MSEEPTIADYEAVLADHCALVRRLDVALNGEENAARQASLCDIVGQVEHGKWALVRQEEIARLREALIPFAGFAEISEAETAVTNESLVTIRCQLGDVRRAFKALNP
jgi:hypothetical protein